MQRSGKVKVIGTGRSIECEITAVDHEIRAGRIDVSAHPLEIVGQTRQSTAKMGIGNLGEAKFGHAALVTLRIADLPERDCRNSIAKIQGRCRYRKQCPVDWL